MSLNTLHNNKIFALLNLINHIEDVVAKRDRFYKKSTLGFKRSEQGRDFYKATQYLFQYCQQLQYSYDYFIEFNNKQHGKTSNI